MAPSKFPHHPAATLSAVASLNVAHDLLHCLHVLCPEHRVLKHAVFLLCQRARLALGRLLQRSFRGFAQRVGGLLQRRRHGEIGLQNGVPVGRERHALEVVGGAPGERHHLLVRFRAEHRAVRLFERARHDGVDWRRAGVERFGEVVDARVLALRSGVVFGMRRGERWVRRAARVVKVWEFVVGIGYPGGDGGVLCSVVVRRGVHRDGDDPLLTKIFQ